MNLFQCMNIFFIEEMLPKVRCSRKTLYYVPLNSCEKQQVAFQICMNDNSSFVFVVVSFNDNAH